MKTEKPILIVISLALLVFAIFMSYNTQFPKDDASGAGYLADMENYKTYITNKIATDNKRIAVFNARFETEKSESRKGDELSMLQRKINGMQTKLNNYDEDGFEAWKLFRKEFDHDLNELHQSLKTLTRN